MSPTVPAALDDAVLLCAELGHELTEAGLPEITPAVGTAIGTEAARPWSRRTPPVFAARLSVR